MSVHSEKRSGRASACMVEFLEPRLLMAGNSLGGEWLGMNLGNETTASATQTVMNDFTAVGLTAVRNGGNAITSAGGLGDQDARINVMVNAGQEIHWVINYRGNGINPAGTGRTEIAALDINGATMTTWFNNYKQRCIDLFTRYSSPGNVLIKNYIVGNEPDLNDNFTSLAGRPDIAVKLTRAMWEAAEQVNPAIIVESPPTGAPDSTYLQSMINGGVAQYCDVIGVHMYGDQTQWGRATKPWEWLAAAGVTNKPVGISEAGVTTGWNPTWSTDARQWQSDWMDNFYVMAKRFGYSYGILFTHDDDHTADWALLRAGGVQVQPSWNEIDNTLTNPQGLRNAGFETANDVRRQWYPEHDPDNAFPSGFNWQYATNPKSGSYCAQIRTNSGWDTSAHQVIDNLTPGQLVRVTAWVRSDSPSGGYFYVSGSNATNGDADVGSTTVTSSTWTQVSVDVTPTNPWIVISLTSKKNSSTSYVYFDDITVTQIPNAPSNVTATAASSSQINLGWTDNSANETGFKIERATDAQFTQNLTLVTTTAAGVTSYSNTGLSGGTTYYYRIRATNSLGDSANSNTASATTASANPVTLVSYDFGKADGTPWNPNNVPSGMTASNFGGAGGDNLIMNSTYTMKRSNQTNAANQNDIAGAVANGDYWTFTVTPDAGRSLSLSQLQFQVANRYGGTFTSGTGVSSFHVFSSVDGFTYNPPTENDLISSITVTNSTSAWQTVTIDLSAAKFQNLTSAVTFRIYVADNGSEKDYGAAMDNLALSGVVN